MHWFAQCSKQIIQKMIIFPAGGLTVDSVVLWYRSWNRLTFQFQFCSILPKLFPPYSGSHYQIAKPLVLVLGKDAAVQIWPSLRLSETRDYLLSLRQSTGKMRCSIGLNKSHQYKISVFLKFWFYLNYSNVCWRAWGVVPTETKTMWILFTEL